MDVGITLAGGSDSCAARLTNASDRTELAERHTPGKGRLMYIWLARTGLIRTSVKWGGMQWFRTRGALIAF